MDTGIISLPQLEFIREENKSHIHKTGDYRGSGFSDLLSDSLAQQKKDMPAEKQSLIRIGSLSRENPTVSHLLIKHPQAAGQCWEIIHDPVNQDKPFQNMAMGETVWLDTETREIVLGNFPVHKTAEPGPSAPRPNENLSLSGSLKQSSTLGQTNTRGQTNALNLTSDPGHASVPGLTSALGLTSDPGQICAPDLTNPPDLTTRQFQKALLNYVGTPYSDLNCYELVVQGLQDIGMRYYGKNGLQSELIHKALSEDRPLNAYLTGEGLIQSLSGQMHQRSYYQVQQPEQEAKQLMQELKDQLEPGMIFSVSTRTSGHTGVISRHEGEWTLINSGRTEYSIRESNHLEGVEEEILHKELAKWFRRAKAQGSGLMVSIGGLSMEKLSRFMEVPDSIPRA